MNAAGWILMVASCGTVLALVVFCFYKVFTSPDIEEDVHAPLEIDTHEEIE